mgnify:CR=1 FL=1|jgi:hypothetical protein
MGENKINWLLSIWKVNCLERMRIELIGVNFLCKKMVIKLL